MSKPKRVYRCRECDQLGHNTQTCPNLAPPRKPRPSRAKPQRVLQLARPTARGYRQICVSMYDTDLAVLDTYVHRCKVGGLTRMSRSRLIALAVSRLDIDALIGGGR